MRAFIGCAALALSVAAEEAATEAAYAPPSTVAGAFFFEPFTASEVSGLAAWTVSKDEDFKGEWKVGSYAEPEGLAGDTGLIVSSPAQKHAISTVFAEPFDPKGTGLVVQYELQLQKTLECGGAYIKLLSASEALSTDGFKADTPYTIMFGPDKCGATNKVHFILRHKNPISGDWEEKHITTPPSPIIDKKTHLYTAIVGADNTVKILIDGKEKKSASLLTKGDFNPDVNPPKQIDDPEDSKPEDWVDEAKIDDPEASKPEDWDEDAPQKIDDPKATKPAAWEDDEPLTVSDPSAEQPSDWDADEDGEWEAPMVANPKCKPAGCGEWKPPTIANPDYKGKWYAPKIDNPAYKGVWSPAQIDNPNFFVDEQPHAMAPIGGVGIELWTMQDGILFDNILVTSDPAVASSLAAASFDLRTAEEKKSSTGTMADLKREPGFVGAITYYTTKAFYFARDNLLAVGLAFCLGLIPLLLFCCFGRSKDATPADDDDAVDSAPLASDAPADEPEPEPEPEPAPEPAPETKKPNTRKRTPKAA